MRRPAVWTTVILLAVVGLVAIYSVQVWANHETSWIESGYWQAVVAGVLSTLVGVILGLPAAIWLHEKADERERLSAERNDRRALEVNRRRVLRVAEEELNEASGFVRELSDGQPVRHVHVNVARWAAMAQGGDTRWVNDEQASSLARAYEELDTINMLAAQWLVAASGGSGPGNRAQRSLEQLLRAEATDAVPLVEDALRSVRKALSERLTDEEVDVDSED